MSAIILRRRKLGRTSCREISSKSTTDIVVVRNDKTFPIGIDLVFRWGTTSNVPTDNVVNTAEAIHKVNDKLEFRRVLQEHELCPKTWFDYRDSAIVYPVVVRPRKHAQGRNLFVCNNITELTNICHTLREGNYYISELISKVAEYRVTIVQGRVAWVAKKTPADPSAVAWNVAQGGRFDNVRWEDWPLRAVRISTEAFMLSGLDFGAIDIMVSAEEKCYVLEINSAPSQTSPYRQECMAKCFDYIVRNGKEFILLIEGRGNYRKFIHPAVCVDALI
mgnify:CR=1 FL=1